MEGFSPLDRFLLFATVGGMFASLAFYAAQRTARFWKEPFVRFTRSSRAAQTLVVAFLVAVTAIGGNKGGTNDPPLRAGGGLLRTIPAEDLPAWFVALGYPATDADASGIPDCWERWTHTAGMSSDADPDGDGLTNLAEFEAQTDPIRADTDGDGIDDATELAGLAAGVPDLDPVTPATFAADEPDADGDGIPDLWENADIALFDGVDPDGVPWFVNVPEPATNNYDVLLSVTSSRHAALSWGADWGESLLLPPCTNLALRLRLSADDDRRISLAPHPAVGAATGLWKAELVAAWDPRRNQETEANRVRTGGGTIVDAEEDGARFVGVLAGTVPQMRGAPSRGGGRDEAGIWFWRKSIELSGTAYCAVHGPALVVTATCENVSPPLEWSVTGKGTVSNGETVFVPSAHGWEGASTEVVCTKRDGKSRILLRAQARYDAVPCGQPQTNIVGACTLSSHDPLDPADHEPRIEEHVVRYLPQCPPTTNVTVVAGFTHDTAILWIRNLVRIVTGDPMDDETDHCFAYDWIENDILDLWRFVAESTVPYTNLMSIAVDGRVGDGLIRLGSEPKVFHPDIHHVELRLKDSNIVLDRFWIVINGTETKREFGKWFGVNATNLAWVATLPRPYAQLDIATNFWGNEYAVDPEPGYPYLWKAPKNVGGNLLHHDAVYTMRAPANSEGHGNQACYRADGSLIRFGMSGGTADFAAGEATSVFAHVEQDVDPFLHALLLDGNPCGITTFNNITRPCLRQGEYIDKYIQCRPVVQP